MTRDVILSPDGFGTELKWDDQGVTLRHFQDMGQIDKGLEQFRHGTENSNRRSNLRHAARVPLVLWHQWQDEFRKTASQYQDWGDFLKRKINDPEFKKLRNQAL